MKFKQFIKKHKILSICIAVLFPLFCFWYVTRSELAPMVSVYDAILTDDSLYYKISVFLFDDTPGTWKKTEYEIDGDTMYLDVYLGNYLPGDSTKGSDIEDTIKGDFSGVKYVAVRTSFNSLVLIWPEFIDYWKCDGYEIRHDDWKPSVLADKKAESEALTHSQEVTAPISETE